MTHPTQIGFLGGGHMSRALISGLVSRANSEIGPSSIHVFDRNAEKNNSLHNEFDINKHASAVDLVSASDVVIIAIKPQGVKQALLDLRSPLLSRPRLLLSVAAGVTTHSMQDWLGDSVAIARAMPNMSALIGQGATGLYACHTVTDQQKGLVEQILTTVGVCEWVDSDQQLDLVTALSGSGPAYFLLMLNSMIKHAVKAGLNEASAKRLAIQTMKGTALLIEQGDAEVADLIDQIRSPNGTTDRAIRSFTKDDLDTSVANAMQAAQDRAQEMACNLDN